MILQHPREQFHPFNTARIVHKALKNSTLLVEHLDRLASNPIPLSPTAGILYPGSGAKLLPELSPEERPSQLVILDGTWHHVRTMMRDLPFLSHLTRYQLLPEEPGRYRIRREPNATSLSTLEATVAALKALEPDTVGLDQLTVAFDTMIERQLTHHKAPTGHRRNLRRNRTVMNVPRALAGDLDDVVVAYGESTPGKKGEKRRPRLPVYWVAERLATGERFTAAIQTETPLDDTFLGHLELTPEDFANALSPDQFRQSWSTFLRPTDTLVVYQPNTAQLLRAIDAQVPKAFHLKSIDFEDGQHYTSLESILEAKSLPSNAAPHSCRAVRRLDDAITLVRYLNAQKHGD